MATTLQVDEDDNISVTSTIDPEENSEIEWYAECIIAERIKDGSPRYLVEWTDYPLAEATWEPADHLSENLLQQWEEQKAKVAAGHAEKFRIRRWRDAVVQQLQAKHVRHLKRNALRLSRGLQTTTWVRSLEKTIEAMVDYWPNDPSDNGDSSTEEGEADIQEPDSLPKPPASLPAISPAARTEAHLADKHPLPPKPPPQAESELETRTGGSRTSAEEKSNGEVQMLASASQPPPALPKRPPGAQTQTNTALPKRVAAVHPVENVFSGGTIRKKRVSLSEIAADSTKGTKFLKARYNRIIEKGSRDRENDEPKQLPKNLICLDSKTPSTTIASNRDDSDQRNTSLEAGKDTDADADVDKPALSRRSSLKTTTRSKDPDAERSRRKSVHWDDNVQLLWPSSEPSLFVDDESQNGPFGAAEQDNSTQRIVDQPKPRYPSPNLSEDANALSEPTRNEPKKCYFGVGAQRHLHLLFRDIPHDHSARWLADFLTQDSLVFSHSCTAQDFFSQFRSNPIRPKDLAAGCVTGMADVSEFETIATRLRLGSQGIICHAENYCVLLFPCRSEEWGFEAAKVPGMGFLMKYIVLPPLGPIESALAKNGVSIVHAEGKLLPRGLLQISNLEYSVVMPPTLQTSAKHYFFLAFPPDALQDARLVATWLDAASRNDCIVYDSLSPGDWLRFVDVAFSGGSAAIIIHEDAREKIRSFPRMFDVLCQAVAGKLTISMFQKTPYPSDSSPDRPVIADISLKRMSLAGKVFLLTPGFILSKPKQACRFLEFFVKHYSGAAPSYKGKLAIPFDMERWVGEVLAERIVTRDKYDPETFRQERDALVRFGTAIAKLKMEDELDSSLIVAPKSIDPNDEQSLVNWFGWWTTRHLDDYGRAYVFGSGDAMDRMTLHIAPVRYLKDASNDPELEWVLLSGRADNTSENGEASTETARDAASGRRNNFNLVANDEPYTIRNYLKDLYIKLTLKPSNFWLFFKPIGYYQPDMAFRLNDIRGAYCQVEEWLNALHPLNKKRAGVQEGPSKNTMGCFLYTPDEDWETTGSSRDGAVKRHPWIAVLRPCNPHIRPWLEIEMLIWDVRYRDKFTENKQVREEDLYETHRKVIKLASEHNAVKNPGMPLSKVWVGGWSQPQTKYECPLDITLDYVGKFSEHVKLWLPAHSSMLPVRGWKFVHPAKSGSSENKDGDGDVIMDIGDAENESVVAEEESEDDNDNRKMIFHPPRGSCKGAGGRSTCKNVLYIKCQAAVRNATGEKFPYTFPATKMWYGQQVAEGRDFKHMIVDTWTAVFAQLRLPTAD